MKNTTQSMVLTAMFVALTLLLGLTPLGLIPLGFINVTSLFLPVITGTILLGLPTGLLLGLCFGFMSAMSMVGLSPIPPSALAGKLLSQSPALALIMCFLPRLLLPISVHLVYRLFARGKESNIKAVPAAAIAGTVTNTVFYLGLMLLFYRMTGLDSAPVMTVITGAGLIAGGTEAVVAAVVTSPVIYAIWKLQHRT